MARKANSIGPHVLTLIEDARVGLGLADVVVRRKGDVALDLRRRPAVSSSEHGATIVINSAVRILGDFDGTRPGQNLS